MNSVSRLFLALLLCLLSVSVSAAGEKADRAIADSVAAANAADLFSLNSSDDASGMESAPAFKSLPLKLGPEEVIRLTVRFSPFIRRAYERKREEESRYKFFIVSREAFTYGARTDFLYSREHFEETRDIDKALSPSVFVTKEFYDTTSTSLRVGYNLGNSEDDGDSGNAFVAAGVTLPLFASREALERSNDKIYQENRVNDARLEYFREIRMQIHMALNSFSETRALQESLRYQVEYIGDLKSLLDAVSSVTGRDTALDRSKAEATLASARAEEVSNRGEFEVSKERLKMDMGIPFSTPVEIKEDRFDPFDGETGQDLEKVALATDEEIKTLLNSVRSSQAELELARKGKWDTSLFIDARRGFLGSGTSGGDMSYSLLTGVSVSHIDSRISRNLEDVALASLRGYRIALHARRRGIHTDTTDACSTLRSQAEEVKAKEANISNYRNDYVQGVEQYKAGAITIDELIKRRKDLYNELSGIAWARQRCAHAIAELLSSTGRYEQFLDADPADTVRGAGATAPHMPVESTAAR